MGEAKTEKEKYDLNMELLSLRNMVSDLPGVNEKTQDENITNIEIELARTEMPFTIGEVLLGRNAKTVTEDFDRRRKLLDSVVKRMSDKENEINMLRIDLNDLELAPLEGAQKAFRESEDDSFFGWYWNGNPNNVEKIMELRVANVKILLDSVEKDKNMTEETKKEHIRKAHNLLESIEYMAKEDKKEETEDVLKTKSRLRVIEGRVELEKGEDKEAIKLYSEAIALDEGNVDAYLGMVAAEKNIENTGGLSEEEKKPVRARIALNLEKAIEKDPSIDGVEMKKSQELVKLYYQLNQFDKVEEILEKILSGLANPDSKKIIKKIRSDLGEDDSLEVWAKNAKDRLALAQRVIEEAVEITDEEKEIAGKRETLEKVKDDKNPLIKPSVGKSAVYLTAEDMEIMIRETNIKKRRNNASKDQFKLRTALEADPEMFLQVIGNARGKPQDEAIAELEAFLEIVEVANLKSPELLNRLYYALAEQYDKAGKQEKALESIDKIEYVGKSPIFAAEIYILRARILLKKKKDEVLQPNIEDALTDLETAMQFIGNVKLDEEKEKLSGQALSVLNTIIPLLAGEEISPDQKVKYKTRIYLIFETLQKLGDLTEASEMVAGLAVEDLDISFIEGILENENISQGTKKIFLEAIIGKISDQLNQIPLSFGSNFKGFTYSSLAVELNKNTAIRGAIENLTKDENEDSVRNAATLLMGLTGKGRSSREYLKKALKADPELKDKTFFNHAMMLSYSLNRIGANRYRGKTLKTREVSAELLIAEGDKYRDKDEHLKAAKKYEEAISKEPNLREDKTFRAKFHDTYDKAKKPLRENINITRGQKEKHLKSENERLRNKMEVSDKKSEELKELIKNHEKLRDSILATSTSRGSSWWRLGILRERDKEKLWAKFKEDIVKANLELAKLQIQLMGQYIEEAESEEDEATRKVNLAEAKNAMAAAKKTLQTVIDYDFANREAKTMIEAFPEAISVKSAENLIKEAESEISEGNFEAAEKLLNQAEEKDKETTSKDKTVNENKIKKLNSIIERIWDGFAKEEYIEKYGEVDSLEDKKLKLRKRVQSEAENALSRDDARKVYDTIMSIATGWREYDTTVARQDETLLEMKNELLENVNDDSLAETETDALKIIVFKRTLILAEKLINEGQQKKAGYILDVIAGMKNSMTKKVNPKELQKLVFLRARAEIALTTDDELLVVESIIKDAQEKTAETSIDPDEEMRATLALDISKIFANRANAIRRKPSVDKNRDKGRIRRNEESKAVNIINALIENPANGSALNAFLELYQGKNTDRLFSTTRNKDALIAAIGETTDIPTLVKILRKVLGVSSVQLMPNQVEVVEVILDKIIATTNLSVDEALNLLSNLTEDLKYMPVQNNKKVFDKVVEKVETIEGRIEVNEAYKHNPGAESTVQLTLLYLALVSGNVVSAKTLLGNIVPVTKDDRKKLAFAKFRIHLMEDPVSAAETQLGFLAKIAPELTPQARILIAEKYLKMASSNNLRSLDEEAYLKKAVDYYPDYLIAREALLSLYEKNGKIEKMKKQAAYIKRLKTHEARSPLQLEMVETAG